MAGKSRMNREVHVRFCEGLGVKFPRATRLATFLPSFDYCYKHKIWMFLKTFD